jgi:hypothetical protein
MREEGRKGNKRKKKLIIINGKESKKNKSEKRYS